MQDYPMISVVMPVYNEVDFIDRSLAAVLNQDYPADKIEIFIVDGMSRDGTREIVANYQKKHSNIRLMDNFKKIVSIGLNAALREARGEIIVRVDGHTLIDPDYIRNCVEELQESKADNVGGKMTAVGQTALGQAVALATSHSFGIGSARFHYSDQREWVDTVYLGAWQREIFDKIGLFDEALVRNQDDEWNYRLREKGGRILLSPRIKSQYFCRKDLRSLWLQYFQYGYWKVRILQKHPRQMQWRQFVPPAFVLSLLAAFALALFGKSFLLILVGGVYAAANLGASFCGAFRSSFRYFLLLPLVYGILHLSYGLGFLMGLIKFSNRWRSHPLL